MTCDTADSDCDYLIKKDENKLLSNGTDHLAVGILPNRTRKFARDRRNQLSANLFLLEHFVNMYTLL